MTQRGVIKWFDSKKGFGFSTPAEGGTDIFVHHTHITTVQGRPVLDEGDEIAYDLGEHNGRPTAIKVTMANGDPVSGLRRRTGGRPPRGSGGDDGDAKGDAEPEANGEVSPAKEGVLEPSDVTSYARDGKTRREGGRRDGQPSSRSKSVRDPTGAARTQAAHAHDPTCKHRAMFLPAAFAGQGRRASQGLGPIRPGQPPESGVRWMPLRLHSTTCVTCSSSEHPNVLGSSPPLPSSDLHPCPLGPSPASPGTIRRRCDQWRGRQCSGQGGTRRRHLRPEEGRRRQGQGCVRQQHTSIRGEMVPGRPNRMARAPPGHLPRRTPARHVLLRFGPVTSSHRLPPHTPPDQVRAAARAAARAGVARARAAARVAAAAVAAANRRRLWRRGQRPPRRENEAARAFQGEGACEREAGGERDVEARKEPGT